MRETKATCFDLRHRSTASPRLAGERLCSRTLRWPTSSYGHGSARPRRSWQSLCGLLRSRSRSRRHAHPRSPSERPVSATHPSRYMEMSASGAPREHPRLSDRADPLGPGSTGRRRPSGRDDGYFPAQSAGGQRTTTIDAGVRTPGRRSSPSASRRTRSR